jgi:hypothetical protein
MDYKVTSFIGNRPEAEGWQSIEGKDLIRLENNLNKIEVKIDDETAIIEVIGEGWIILKRDNKCAKLPNGSKGMIKAGDEIFLLNKEAEIEFENGVREGFEGAAIKVEIRNQILEIRNEKKEIYINERSFSQEKNSKSANLIMGGIVFVLLIAGTFFGYQKRSGDEQKKTFEDIKNKVEAKLTEAESVRTVNIETALQLTQDAESMVSNTAKIEKKYGSELTGLRKKVAEVKGSLGGGEMEYEVAYDTTLIVEGENQFKGMAIKDSIVYLWNANLGEIDSVDPNLKSKEKIVADERIKSWLGIFNNGEKWYGYDANKIYEIKRNELVETEIKGVASVGEMTGWGGSTYVLDNGNKNIMKLSEGNGKTWLKDGTNLAEESVGMNIDSNIWVLGKSGKIYKYTRGIAEKYEMSTLTSLSSAKYLRTSDKVEILAYVTDENTVVIYGKDGKILGKYNFSKTKINDIGIENQNKAVLVLGKNGKIYRIKIK